MIEPHESRLPSLPRNPLRFDSKSEFACGAMLECYVPNFELIMGQTLQIKIGKAHSIDFMINGVFFEYHPIVFDREFDSRGALYAVENVARELQRQNKTHLKNILLDAIHDELKSKYFRRRRLLLDLCLHKNSDLIVAYSPRDFYRSVLKRFGTSLPKETDALHEFQKICQSV